MQRGITIHLADKTIWLHESIFSTFIITAILVVLALIINGMIKRADYREKPTGLLHIVEILVEAIDKLVISVMGASNLSFAPYVLTLAVYLAFANLSGLLGFVPPTSDYNVTLALALITFFLIQYNSIRTKKLGGYFKQFLEPIAILAPINIIGEISNPISLSFRLFGNILSGALIMYLVYMGLAGISRLLIPIVAWPLHGYFDVFSGFLQTFIFIMLSMTYIKSNMADDEEEL